MTKILRDYLSYLSSCLTRSYYTIISYSILLSIDEDSDFAFALSRYFNAPSLSSHLELTHYGRSVHEVFPNDLMYFLCCEYNFTWRPPAYASYTICSRSPVTLDMQRAVRVLVHDRMIFYLDIFRGLFTSELGDNLGNFHGYSRTVLIPLFWQQKNDAGEVLLSELGVGMVGVFYRHGILGAPTVAVVLIEEVMVGLNVKFNLPICSMLSLCASEVIYNK